MLCRGCTRAAQGAVQWLCMGCAGVVLTRLAGAEVVQGRTGAAQGLRRGCAGAVQKLCKSCAGAGAAQVLCRGGADAPG